MKQIALIHFLPLEYYPPVTNMINYLSEKLNSERNLSVFSTQNTKNRTVYYNKSVKIYRTASSENTDYRFVRLWKYFVFQISVFFKLIIIRPENILYYESLSSFSVFLYKRFINHSVKIYIHYHEYVSPDEYANKSMATERFFHKPEQKYLYKNSVWISHTNKDRLKMFLNDYPNIDKNILKEMPNYPPKLWTKVLIRKPFNIKKNPLKCVYIGALSFEETYIKEFTEWVLHQTGNITFDIFTYNLYPETNEYLQNIQSPYIKFNCSGVEYSNLPLILSQYHVGIILYKANTKNYEFNAPNKLFEYLTCGLDVWFPDVMKGILPYVQIKNPQKIVPLDFNSINKFDWKNSITLTNFNRNDSFYICEKIYKRIIKGLNS